MAPRTLFDKIWDDHVIQDLGGGWTLLHVDRHLLHDLSGPPSLDALVERRLPVHNPELTFATPDHAVSTQPGRMVTTFAIGGRLHASLQSRCRELGVRMFDLGEQGQGIVHVIGPELGLVLPGLTVICGDSHTCTNGALGALSFGVGSSESTHALATQTLRLQKPRQLRIHCAGRLSADVTSKDLALYILGKLGTRCGSGHVIEFCGPAIEALDVEARMTLCNLASELGARSALVAPDQRTFDYLEGRTFTPRDGDFDVAVAYWRNLAGDPGAAFDREEFIDASAVPPCITWGTSPGQVIPIDGRVPSPAQMSDDKEGEAVSAAIRYMGLRPGQLIAGTPIDWVFIGSCANSRLSDLRAAAQVIRNRTVAPGVTAWVVPGSENIKRLAEAEGLHAVFEAAGFSWREPGCSMCVGANQELVPSGQRIVSTSNRNFVGRQGPGSRTHLASPVVAAAAAIAGAIVRSSELEGTGS